NPAVGVVDVAENDRLGRAGLLARGLQRAIVNFLFGSLGIDAALVDALHTVRALLHDAAAAHADVGISHHLVLRSVPVLEEQEVEAPYLVRAIIGAVARADAAVVHHIVQAFSAVQGGANRANQFAGRVFALHTWNRLEERLGIVAVALIVGVHANP